MGCECIITYMHVFQKAMEIKMKKIGFVGIGKLGLACAQVMARAGHQVTGYDIYPRTSEVIKVAKNLKEAIEGKDMIFIAVQTPHDPIYDGSQPVTHLENKDFDYSVAVDVLRGVNQYVKPNQMVVLISTVLPGTTRSLLRQNITNARFVYNPYLIAMGSVEWDMVNPEMVIIGTEDGSMTGDAKELIDFYKGFMQNDPRYVVGTWDEAECIKIFYNTFISAKVGLVNMIQDVAIKNGNIDVDVVTSALAASNMRIMGPKYMIAGMGDAGPCVLPSFKVNVNNEKVMIGDLFHNFNQENTFIVDSSNYACTAKDEKKIAKVTETQFEGDMIEFDTDVGKITLTPNHLMPVEREGKRILVRADSILLSDKLYKL